MLKLKPSCEHCGKPLPNDSTEAMICSFECTFCKSCVDTILQNVCPNCGGGFERRPVRPNSLLVKYPASTETIYKPVNMESFRTLMEKNKNVEPNKR